MTQPKRSSLTSRMLSENVAYREDFEKVQALKHKFVQATQTSSGAFAFTNTESITAIPLDSIGIEAQWVHKPGGMLSISFLNEQEEIEQLRQVLRIRDLLRIEWGHRNSIFGDLREYYDDAAELFAQMNLRYKFGLEASPRFSSTSLPGDLSLRMYLQEEHANTVTHFLWENTPAVVEGQGTVIQYADPAGFQSEWPEEKRHQFMLEISNLMIDIDLFAIRGEEGDYFVPAGWLGLRK